MKKIEINLHEKQTWVEETHAVHLTGYEYNDRKAAENEIKKMLDWDESKVMEIEFTWCADNLCIVDFKYETREVR